MADVYALVNKANAKYPQSRSVLSGIIRRRDVTWQHIRALNGRDYWKVKILQLTFIHQNIWIGNWGFGKNGLHINPSGSRRLSQMYSRVGGFGSKEQNLNE
jgi:hypothetical protein